MVNLRKNVLKEYGIQRDSRFIQAGKEAVSIAVLFVANTVWVFGFAVWGSVTDQTEYPYILGLPLWMTLALVGGIIAYPVIGIVFALRIHDCSLDEVDPMTTQVWETQ